MAESTKERLRQVFVGRPLEQRFLASALAELLGDEKTEQVLDEIQPVSRLPSDLVGGLPVITYSGLSREQIKTNFNLSDADVDEIYEKLGVTEDKESSDSNDFESSDVVEQEVESANESVFEPKSSGSKKGSKRSDK